MSKKKSLQVYLDDYERSAIEQISSMWGCSLSAAIKRLIREQASRIQERVGIETEGSQHNSRSVGLPNSIDSNTGGS